ncbi:DUF7471 family protein [Natronomonas pharaonis]|nr:hypothetical protein [Natronomonas pharaonis]
MGPERAAGDRDAATKEMNGLKSHLGSWLGPELAPILLCAIALAILGTMLLFALGVAAYLRTRSDRYLLLAAATGALVARSLLGLGTVFDIVPMFVHHLVAHSLDFLVALTILVAAYLHRGSDNYSTNT